MRIGVACRVLEDAWKLDTWPKMSKEPSWREPRELLKGAYKTSPSAYTHKDSECHGHQLYVKHTTQHTLDATSDR